MQNSYTVINASAGSGKTYILIQRILMICLMYPNQHTIIRNILALTFTNKAANEMKERILEWLEKFSDEEFYAQCQELISLKEAMEEAGQKVDIEEIHLRSKKLLEYLLHHYSILNIGTIDKFNARLVRSFSHELGLAKNFSLEIQSEPFLQQAVDQFFNKIGENEEITETLINYVDRKLQEEEKVNLNQTMYDAARELISDIHYEQLSNNKFFDTKAFNATLAYLRKENNELLKSSTLVAKEAIALMKANGLEAGDFAGGKKASIMKFFIDFLATKSAKLRTSDEDEQKKLDAYRKGASAKSKDKESNIFAIVEDLIEKRRKIIFNEITVEKNKKIIDALLPLKVNKDIQKELEIIEQENDVVLLSKFNILIHDNLKDEPSAFIYEKIGTQIQHFFFDEFQDTSALQWENFLPLRDHTLSQDATSFTLVGDPKQSIYRFRGGDSQIMMDIINHKEITPKPASIITLESNWRSAKNIVEFNNQLYKFISNDLETEHQAIFGENSQQIAKSALTGYVRVNLFENATEEVFFEEMMNKMHEDIQDCINNGFQFSDITILTRKNAHSLTLAKGLNTKLVDYNGVSTNIKTISEEGLTLEMSNTLQAVISMMNWKYQPKDYQHLSRMIYYLHQLGRINLNQYSEEIAALLKLDDFDLIVDEINIKYGINILPKTTTKFNLYTEIEYYVNLFSVEGKETDFLLNFLELLHAFSQQKNTTLKDFIIYWDEEASQKSIQASDNIDAIKLMTIHKAKGLEFPIVFLPMQNKHNDDKFNDWYAIEDNENLNSVNIQGFKKELTVYDKQIENFNEANEYKNRIDRLCVQYVATTRPVEQLFLYLEKPLLYSTGSYKESAIKIYDFVQKANVSNTDSFDYFQVNEEGKLKKTTKIKQTENRISITKLQSHPTTNSSIQIATPSKNYQATNDKLKEGIFTHEILAQINASDDTEKILEGYWLKGLITNEERKQLLNRINLVTSKYPEYFRADNNVLNEKDIMISHNGQTSVYRPDRLILKDQGVIIIDFKTGLPESRHENQMQTYQKALEHLGLKVYKKEIIYL